GVKRLDQGAGFVNAIGAVRLARFYATAQPGEPIPTQRVWSKHIFWGNHMLTGGVPNPAANAFAVGTNWGVAQTDNGDNIVWGTDDGDNSIWGSDDGNDNIVWGTSDDDNIVWGTDDGGDNIVWGTDDGDNIVWGTDDGDNIIWGSNSSLNQVWEESPDGTK